MLQTKRFQVANGLNERQFSSVQFVCCEHGFSQLQQKFQQKRQTPLFVHFARRLDENFAPNDGFRLNSRIPTAESASPRSSSFNNPSTWLPWRRETRQVGYIMSCWKASAEGRKEARRLAQAVPRAALPGWRQLALRWGTPQLLLLLLPPTK